MGLRGAVGFAAAAKRALRDRNLDIAEAVAEVAAELGVAPSAVAVAWCLTRRGVTSVILGARTAQQLRDTLPAFDLTLPDDALKRLGDVSRIQAP